MRQMRRHMPWGRRGPRPLQAVLLGAAAIAVAMVLYWVWSSVVGVYFSSIVILPGYGMRPVPDFAGMFFHALRLAAVLSLLVLSLIVAAGLLAWQLWQHHERWRHTGLW